MKQIQKGSSGYIRREKVKRGLIALLMFAIPLVIFFTGLITTGTRKNLLTVVAILGVIPAARFAVSWIMIMLQKDAPEYVVQETEKVSGDMVHAYELTVTAYEGRMPLDAVVVRGGSVAGLSLNGKLDQFHFMEKHIEQILAKNGCRSVRVKIFAEMKPFLERISSMKKAEEKKAEEKASREKLDRERLAQEQEAATQGAEDVTEEDLQEEGSEIAGYDTLTRDERILAVIKAISL